MSSEPIPEVGIHWQLHAYVSASEARGFSGGDPCTFTKIMQDRPKDCRFAVARRIAMAQDMAGKLMVGTQQPIGPFVVWDLYDDQLVRGKRTGPSGLIMPPPPIWRGDTLDAMIMKAVMCYDTSSQQR